VRIEDFKNYEITSDRDEVSQLKKKAWKKRDFKRKKNLRIKLLYQIKYLTSKQMILVFRERARESARKIKEPEERKELSGIPPREKRHVRHSSSTSTFYFCL
jgi:putative cell wall-binding protein